MSIHIEVQNHSDCGDIPGAPTIRSWVCATLKQLRRERGELNVRIVDEADSAALNRDYRNKPEPTNVLSFPFENPPHLCTDILGDVVICAPVVAREAQQLATTRRAHWAHIVVHGVLHLCGHHHGHLDEARKMAALEAEILGGFGFADPWDETATVAGGHQP